MEGNNSIIVGFDNEKDDSLSIKLRPAEGIKNGLFVYLNGYIDTYNSSFFQKKITQIIEKGYINLIFNCSSLNYVSSTGIGSFTVFLKMVKPKAGDIVLLEIQPKVYEVFQLLGFINKHGYFCLVTVVRKLRNGIIGDFKMTKYCVGICLFCGIYCM